MSGRPPLTAGFPPLRGCIFVDLPLVFQLVPWTNALYDPAF